MARSLNGFVKLHRSRRSHTVYRRQKGRSHPLFFLTAVAERVFIRKMSSGCSHLVPARAAVPKVMAIEVVTDVSQQRPILVGAIAGVVKRGHVADLPEENIGSSG